MDDTTILRLSRELSLDFLRMIGAKIQESDGLYYIEIPKQFEQEFGGISKRITFDHDIADAHSCELVVPGSNFLATVLNEVRKVAPVVVASLKKQVGNPTHLLKLIATHNCEASLLDSQEDIKTAIRFYFNVSIKNVKRVAMLRWVDVDLEAQRILEFPYDIQMDHTQVDTKHKKDDLRIDNSYSKATEFLNHEIQPLAQKYASLTTNDQTRDIDSIRQAYDRRKTVIYSDLKLQKYKLAYIRRKIANARTLQSRENHVQQKRKQEIKIKNDEENTTKQIERLTRDKDIQIEQIQKRYRPVVELSLIAAQLYSYSYFRCNLEFRNSASSRQIKADFIDPARSFVIMCDVCGNNLDRAHLCINSHLVCDICSRHCAGCLKDVCVSCEVELSSCYICRDVLCLDCVAKCSFCSETACPKHMSDCPPHSKDVCYFCSDSCQVCHARFCDASISHCSKCGKRICDEDSINCVECDLQFCPSDINICAICGKKHCFVDAATCEFCEQTYSKDCLDGKSCSTCKMLKPLDRDGPEVTRVIRMNPDLAKFKKWQGSANSRFSIFKAKKMLGSRLVIYDMNLDKIILDKRGGWI